MPVGSPPTIDSSASNPAGAHKAPAVVTIVVPALGRPDRVQPLIENVAEATSVPYQLLFVASKGDDAEIAALRRHAADWFAVDWRPGPGDYARKVNAAYRATEAPFVFTGADDLRFHPDWDTAALAGFERAGVGVVGTNDLCNDRVMRGDHSTHSLVARWYADQHGTIDGPGAILAECYEHEYVDDELVGTAKHRKAFAHVAGSVVEHLHPACGKAPADHLTRHMAARMNRSRAVYRQRQRSWNPVRSRSTAPVSVIVATFGDESWRQLAQERALASIAAQRLQPAEVITEHGPTLAEARNTAARRAQSRWLCFVDADDELEPGFFVAMRQPMMGGRAGVLNPSVRTVLPGGEVQPLRMFPRRDLAKGNYLVIGCPVRRNLFEQAGGFDPRWPAWEDWAFWRRVVALGGRVVDVRRAVYRYHWRDDSRNNTVEDKQGLWDAIAADFDAWKGAR